MPKEDWASNTIPVVFSRAKLWPWGEESVGSVLDVACGLSLKSKYIKADLRVGVDIHPLYFSKIESSVPYELVACDVRAIGRLLPPNSFDLVIALDIIEHIEKHEAYSLIQQCETIARRAVVLETPKGYIPQDIDVWGYDGHQYHTHRCGWEPHELESLGYSVLQRPYRMQDIKRHSSLDVDPNITLMDAIKFLDQG